MTRPVLLLQHMDDPRDDRVAAHLAGRGFALEWRNPARGEALPAAAGDYAAVVVYGGVQSVNDAAREAWMRAELEWIRRWVLDGGRYLGLCLGAQLLARSLGAEVGRHRHGLHEIGFVPVSPTPAGRPVLPAPLHVYQWHNEGFDLPDGAQLLARGEVFPHQAFRVGTRAFGLQFHPEATPAMRSAWLTASAHALNAPGAHDRARQERDARRYDDAMAVWLRDFLDVHVLPEAGA